MRAAEHFITLQRRGAQTGWFSGIVVWVICLLAAVRKIVAADDEVVDHSSQRPSTIYFNAITSFPLRRQSSMAAQAFAYNPMPANGLKSPTINDKLRRRASVRPADRTQTARQLSFYSNHVTIRYLGVASAAAASIMEAFTKATAPDTPLINPLSYASNSTALAVSRAESPLQLAHLRSFSLISKINDRQFAAPASRCNQHGKPPATSARATVTSASLCTAFLSSSVLHCHPVASPRMSTA